VLTAHPPGIDCFQRPNSQFARQGSSRTNLFVSH
jgi:hypothetical protein